MEIEVDGLCKADILSLMKALKKYAPKKTILITMNLAIDHFHNRVGEVSVGEGEYKELLQKHMLAKGDSELYEFMGKMILDTLIEDTYYIKSHFDKTVYQIDKEEN